ncbi:ABC transporter substrate-binding protein [Clostridiaceae bacterium M8S5]|nr:ABC transporter substrate-binding protein [Clostridiaceae bacterium M8S5]
MKNYKKVSIYILVLIMSLSFIGCSKEQTEKVDVQEKQSVSQNNDEFENIYPDFIKNETEGSVTYVDCDGEETKLTKKPKKVVVLYNSVLDLWYLAGGKAIARVKGTINVPEEAKDITDLGSFNKVSIESILALKPDLVILMNTQTHKKLKKPLKDNSIEYAVIDASTNAYLAFQKNLYLFTKVLGTEEVYKNKITKIVQSCQQITSKTKEIKEKPSVAVLFSSSKSIKTETKNSLTGEMVYLLGGKNIVKLEELPAKDEIRVDFSIETLIARDPDYIMICTMGDVESCKNRIKNDIETNQAWGSIKAVKNGNVHYLPKEYSVYKPNAKYPEAFKYIAKILYPEVFK